MPFHSKDEIVRKVKDESLRLRERDLLDSGGEWLGAARNWIQWNAVNGDRCEWSSDTPLQLQRSLTPADIELFAARIAAATLREFKHYLATQEEQHALKTGKDENNWRTATPEDLNSPLKRVFDPDPGKLHFAHWNVGNEHGHEVLGFDSVEYFKQQKEKNKAELE